LTFSSLYEVRLRRSSPEVSARPARKQAIPARAPLPPVYECLFHSGPVGEHRTMASGRYSDAIINDVFGRGRSRSPTDHLLLNAGEDRSPFLQSQTPLCRNICEALSLDHHRRTLHCHRLAGNHSFLQRSSPSRTVRPPICRSDLPGHALHMDPRFTAKIP